jgi:uncharacterized protein YndB with AHSA1/START domain
MTSTQVTTGQDAVIAEIDIAAPPERVFSALIDPQQLMQWWGGEGACKKRFWKIDALVGGQWRSDSYDPTGKIADNGISGFNVSGEILEYDPPRLLAYSWVANWHSQPSRTTLVRWKLTPVGKGTRLEVTHSGLADEPVARKDYSGGWGGVVGYLKTFVEK